MKILLDEILAGQHPTFQTAKLKKKLIDAGLKSNSCEECGISETYNGKPIVMHLDHVNGKSDDHRLANLKMLCPNCHSQTDTYSGRNIKNSNRMNLIEKKKERTRIAEEKHSNFVQSRLNDLNRIEKKRGWVGELSKQWNISHTSVARFVKKYGVW